MYTQKDIDNAYARGKHDGILESIDLVRPLFSKIDAMDETPDPEMVKRGETYLATLPVIEPAERHD